jgi:hypothetical protein
MDSTDFLKTRYFYIGISTFSFICTMMVGNIPSQAQEYRMSGNLPRSQNKINSLEIQSLTSRQDIHLGRLDTEEVAPFMFRVINHSSEPQRIIPERFFPEWRKPRGKFQRVEFNRNYFKRLEVEDFPLISVGKSIDFTVNIKLDWSENFGHRIFFSRFFGAIGSVPIASSNVYEVRFCYANEENEHEQLAIFYERHGTEKLDRFWKGTICTPTVKLFVE